MSALRRLHRPLAAILLTLGVLLATCARIGTPPRISTAAPTLDAPTGTLVALSKGTQPFTLAKLVTSTDALSRPAGQTVVTHLTTFVRPGGGPTQLLVLDRRTVGAKDWLRVLLPIRPNTATGWIDASFARLITSPYRIVVSTERRTIEVFDGSALVRSFSAVVGTPQTPTPHGYFAIAERISLSNPNGFYGSWILTLTAHSTILDTFQGGDGRVAIHGRGGKSLKDPLGSARSHGCVRINNAAIDWLAQLAVPGTPVVIE
jgi:lipoprotein-anchoring transpeptidase ErfK/SrfK